MAGGSVSLVAFAVCINLQPNLYSATALGRGITKQPGRRRQRQNTIVIVVKYFESYYKACLIF